MSNHNPDFVQIQHLVLPLTQGYETFIDVVDSDLAFLKYCATVKRKHVYAVYSNKSSLFHGYLHRIIMERMLGRKLKRGEVVDHIDMNGLNNRRSNLRLATNAQNLFNQPYHVNNTSGYKGVDYVKSKNKWRARIRVNGERIDLGLFLSIKEAADAYSEAAAKYHKQFARTK